MSILDHNQVSLKMAKFVIEKFELIWYKRACEIEAMFFSNALMCPSGYQMA